jgi:osmoprotectant transport system substrate-binding protein
LDRKTFLCCLSAILSLAGCSSKSRIIVGSKNFTEQVILGEIIAQHLENRLHRKIERRLNLGGTMLAHQALISKDIDMYPEYTGTAFTNVLKQSGVNDPGVVLERVRAQYATDMHMTWLDPLGFDSSFAMTVRGEDARTRHLETLSDAAADHDGFTLGAGYEFTSRPDGLGALNGMYGIQWISPPKTMDLGLLYTALQQRHVSMIAANTTDGMLNKLDVRVLKDDKQAFPPYQACIVVRADTIAATPGLNQALAELSGKIPQNTMRSLNHAVDADHRPVREVAQDFLRKAGLQ